MLERDDDRYVEMPSDWREGHDGSLACPHRDVSVCPSCASTHAEAVEVAGVHFWVGSAAERRLLRQQIAEIEHG